MADRLCDGLGVAGHAGVVFGLDHDAGQGFGARVANDDAAGAGKILLGGGDGLGYGRDLVERLLLTHCYVDDDLREGDEVGGELGERLAGAVDDVEDEQRGQQAIAGGGAAGEEDVAGLLAAKRGAGGEHLLQHVFIAYRCAEHLDSRAGERGLETHIGHGGGDDGGVDQFALGVEIAGGEQQDGVAVDDFAMLIGKQHTVGIAIERDADGGSVPEDLGGDNLGVERAAAEIDVAAIGAGVGDDDLAAEIGEELRGDSAGGSVGAV